eukprot:Clim_evm99s109 gene=Clim_evmTU99s109
MAFKKKSQPAQQESYRMTAMPPVLPSDHASQAAMRGTGAQMSPLQTHPLSDRPCTMSLSPIYGTDGLYDATYPTTMLQGIISPQEYALFINDLNKRLTKWNKHMFGVQKQMNCCWTTAMFTCCLWCPFACCWSVTCDGRYKAKSEKLMRRIEVYVEETDKRWKSQCGVTVTMAKSKFNPAEEAKIESHDEFELERWKKSSKALKTRLTITFSFINHPSATVNPRGASYSNTPSASAIEHNSAPVASQPTSAHPLPYPSSSTSQPSTPAVGSSTSYNSYPPPAQRSTAGSSSAGGPSSSGGLQNVEEAPPPWSPPSYEAEDPK